MVEVLVLIFFLAQCHESPRRGPFTKCHFKGQWNRVRFSKQRTQLSAVVYFRFSDLHNPLFPLRIKVLYTQFHLSVNLIQLSKQSIIRIKFSIINRHRSNLKTMLGPPPGRRKRFSYSA